MWGKAPRKPPALTVPCVPLYSEGSNLTPAHHFQDFRFKTYAPVAFRYFRELFGIRPDDYLVSGSRPGPGQPRVGWGRPARACQEGRPSSPRGTVYQRTDIVDLGLVARLPCPRGPWPLGQS